MSRNREEDYWHLPRESLKGMVGRLANPAYGRLEIVGFIAGTPAGRAAVICSLVVVDANA